MSDRIKIPIPCSHTPTRIEVWYQDELNREGIVGDGIIEANVKLPAPLEECEIRIIPCNSHGEPTGRGFVYEDETLYPEPPPYTEAPLEEVVEEECCEEPKICTDHDVEVEIQPYEEDADEDK